VDNGGLFADIGISSSRTVLAKLPPLTRWVRKSCPESRLAPRPRRCFLRMITSCIMRNEGKGDDLT
jgi:hypothetical protein